MLMALLIGLSVWGVTEVANLDQSSRKRLAESLARDVSISFASQLSRAYGPLMSLTANVRYQPQFTTVSAMFAAVAPLLLEQVPAGSVRSIQLAPNGVVSFVHPLQGNTGALNLDLFNAASSERPGALKTVADGVLTLVGPMPFRQGGFGVRVRMPIFVTDVDEDAAFGGPPPPADCAPCYDAAARRRFWGFATVLVDLQALAAGGDSRLQALAEKGYRYSLTAPGVGGSGGSAPAEIAGSPAAPTDPQQAEILLPNNRWLLRVSRDSGSWRPGWYSAALAAVVVSSVCVSLLLFAVLVSRRQHQMLLDALLPKTVLRDLRSHQARGGGRGAGVPATAINTDTPADVILAMMGRLLEGRNPELGDIVLVRAVLCENRDIYQPLGIGQQLKDANMDADVAAALMHQLGQRLGSFDEDEAQGGATESGDDDGDDDVGSMEEHMPSETSTLAAVQTVHGALALLMTPQPALWARAGAAADCAEPVLPDAVPPPEGADFISSPVSIAQPGGPLSSSVADQGPLSPARDCAQATAAGAAAAAACPNAGTDFGPLRLPAGLRLSLVGVGANSQGHSSLLAAATAAAGRRSSTTDTGSGRGGGGGDDEGSIGSAPAVAAPAQQHQQRLAPCTPRSIGIVKAAAAAMGGSRLGGGPPPLAPTSRSGSGIHSPGASPMCGFGYGYGGPEPGLSCSTSEVGTGPGSAGVGCLQLLDPRAAASARKALAKQLAQPPAPSLIQEAERVLAAADDWHFDAFRLEAATQGHALSCLAFYLLQRGGMVRRFSLNPLLLARYLRHIEAGYLANPYHNATHAADVLHMLHVMLHHGQLTAHYVDQIGLMAAYIAAVVHDYGHLGLTNDFLVASGAPLALRYNDRSPMENHHCAAAFSALRRPELNFLEPMSTCEVNAFRKQVIEMVMATDMKQHFAILSHFNTVHRLGSQPQHKEKDKPEKEKDKDRDRDAVSSTLPRMLSIAKGMPTPMADAEASLGPAPKPVDEAERMLTLQVALKCADLGNLAADTPVYLQWVDRLEEEFFLQGDKERAAGLPISPLFDRTKQGVSKSQIGFYDFVALPLMHAMTTAFPGVSPMQQHMTANYSYCQQQLQLQQEG